MSVLNKFLRIGEGKKLRALQTLVPDINSLEPEMVALSDEALAHKTVEFKERLANGEDLNDLLTEAFAVVREAAKRTIGQRHYDVQLMGGTALHFGWIAEMKTGEGKTLVSTLPVYLNALEGQGVHVVTVNDYLAARDADWMGKVHRFLGLSVGRISPELPEWQDKKDAYNSDITYGTNTELGFDYLRDNMARNLEHMVQRGHPYAIVDEVDSILIDEARTPLIISGPSNESARLYYQFAGVARSLTRDEDYEVDEEKRTVVPTEDGIEKVESVLGIDNLYDLGTANLVHQLTKAIQAKELYRRDKDYLVADGEVKIVDEFTGRILEGRRWSDGLHQAVEAKERVHDQRREPHLGNCDPAELLPPLRKVGRDDRHSVDRSLGVRFYLQDPGGADPHQLADGASGLPGPHLPVREGQVQRRRGRRCGAVRKRPARPRGYRVGRKVRAALEDVRQTRHPSRGPERQAACQRGDDYRSGGPVARRDCCDQHGGPRRRHIARWQPRGLGPGRGARRGPRPRLRRRYGTLQRALRQVQRRMSGRG